MAPQVLQFIDSARGILGKNFGSVLIGQVVPALDRIIHVPFPGVWFFVAQSGGNSSWAAPEWERVG